MIVSLTFVFHFYIYIFWIKFLVLFFNTLKLIKVTFFFLSSAIFLKVNDESILVSIPYCLDTWKSGVEVVYSAAYDLGNSRQIYI